MAERRMIAKTIIDSDAFLDMPQSTQLLYFHLAMRGDDDGFVNKPKTIMRIT
ncbi:MAG: replisome organizer, partial [Alkaliphilus sp.]|nr:replisome organizer [Alkaliphilus sp.]